MDRCDRRCGAGRIGGRWNSQRGVGANIKHDHLHDDVQFAGGVMPGDMFGARRVHDHPDNDDQRVDGDAQCHHQHDVLDQLRDGAGELS
jgi:hypothetical protein